MEGLLADADVRGHFAVILRVMQSSEWRMFWDHLGIKTYSFEALGLSLKTSDAEVWRTCQKRNLVLVTGNRNQDGPDSLEATLRQENEAASLPVFTLSDARRVSRSKNYASRVAQRLLEYLLDIEKYRGAGRLYLP
jgi:hypothetical protein